MYQNGINTMRKETWREYGCSISIQISSVNRVGIDNLIAPYVESKSCNLGLPERRTEQLQCQLG